MLKVAKYIKSYDESKMTFLLKRIENEASGLINTIGHNKKDIIDQCTDIIKKIESKFKINDFSIGVSGKTYSIYTKIIDDDNKKNIINKLNKLTKLQWYYSADSYNVTIETTYSFKENIFLSKLVWFNSTIGDTTDKL